MLRWLPSSATSPDQDSVPASQAGHDALRALAARAAAGERPAQRTLLCALGPYLLGVIRGVVGQYHPDIETVRSRLRRALRALRERLSADRRLLDVVRGDHAA